MRSLPPGSERESTAPEWLLLTSNTSLLPRIFARALVHARLRIGRLTTGARHLPDARFRSSHRSRRKAASISPTSGSSHNHHSAKMLPDGAPTTTTTATAILP